MLIGDPWVTALSLYNLGLHPLASRWRTAGIAAAATAALISRSFVFLPDPPIMQLPFLNTAFWTAAAGALPLTIGLWVSARRSLLDNLRQQLAQAQETRELELAAARTAERSRIAGEMHDVVAHRVSLMVLHAGALEVSATDPAITDQATLIRQTGRQALHELRTVLGLMCTSPDTELAPPPTLDRLDDLIAASRQAGTNVHLAVEGTARPLPETVERTAYRVIQEGLTNIHKHAPGACATIRLCHHTDNLEVSISNTRPASQPGAHFPHGGHGLLGLRERVEVLGGTFTAQSQDNGGFLVTATLPTPCEDEQTQPATT